METSRVEQILGWYRWVLSWAVWAWLLVSGIGLQWLSAESLITTLAVMLLPIAAAGVAYWLLRRQAQSHINQRMALAFDQLLDDMRAGRWEGYRGVATCVDVYGFGRYANAPYKNVINFMAR